MVSKIFAAVSLPRVISLMVRVKDLSETFASSLRVAMRSVLATISFPNHCFL